tara:strand:+ start:2548 stop:2739 length:192 start_codon:yes stop_codon:yes gene_type:complete
LAEDNTFEVEMGDLVDVISNYKDIIVATGIYLGLDANELKMRILVDDGKVKEFSTTFYYLERL